MLDYKNLLALNIAVAKAVPSAPNSTYSYNGETLNYDAMKATLISNFNELTGGNDYRTYKANKEIIFRLIEDTLDEILPAKVEEAYGRFAEVKTFAQGDKPVFKQKTGSQRAKNFITRVGLAGVYEVFKLGERTFEVPTSAIGGAAQIGIEEFLDGKVDFSELTNIVMEGMDELIYKEIAKAMQAGVTSLQAKNKVVTTTFTEASFDKLIATATAYGKPTIYATYEFATTILPSSTQWSETMKNDKWTNGYFSLYKGGIPVIVLPQSFTDETNATKVIDPAYCWIIPSGDDTKPVKVAFEGQTVVEEFPNRDFSKEIQVYKKVGVGVNMTNNIFAYVNSSLLITN